MEPPFLKPGKRRTEDVPDEAEADLEEDSNSSSSGEEEEEYHTEEDIDVDADEQHMETNNGANQALIVKPTMAGSTAENGIELNSDSESIASTSSEEAGTILVSQRPPPPLLPQHLLQPLPSPASPNTENVAAFKALPWDQLSRGQKANARRRRREAGKKLYARIKADTDGTAVIPAGRFAQAKRGVFTPRGPATVSGRVEKRKIETSGRQRLIAERGREVNAAAQGQSLRRKRQKT